MLNYIRNTDEKQRWLFASVLLNALLSAAKLGWGLMMNSTLVVADGIHSISDVFGALLIFLALFFANHKSERFPYGLHKLEDMAAVMGGLGIVLAGYKIIYSVFFEAGVATPEEIWTTIAFISTIITIQYVFYIFEFKAAIRLNSPGVKADAINWLGDIGAGAIVATGLIAHHFHVPYAQEFAVIVIVLMIFKGAYDVFKEGFLSLLDAVDVELDKKAYKLLMADPDVTEIKRLNIRKSGSVYFADIELKVSDINAIKAHQHIDVLVNKLHKTINNLEAATIHYEPDHAPYQTIVKLLDNDKQHLCTQFGKAAWIKVIHQEESGEIISRKIIPNPVVNSKKGKGFRLVALLLSLRADKVVIGAIIPDENVITLFDALDIEITIEKEKTTNKTSNNG